MTVEKFSVTDPVTGDLVATYPVHGAEDVAVAVKRAREAATWWAELGYAERSQRLTAWKGVIVRRAPQLAGVVHAEMGKPHSDALLEIALAVDHVAWAAKHAKKVLGPQKVSSGMFMANQESTVEYLPLGVVGVIGPWNYPVYTPLGSIISALAAGNAVVYKPSEFTPGVGAWLVDTFAQAVPEQPVLQLITGDGSTGAALCRSGVDKIAFTGSTATGKKVMATCAETLTPVTMECGGKDALIVDADADLDAAAAAAVWGGMSNAGQTCLGVERVYVHQDVYDAFLPKLVAEAESVQAGPDEKIGPITMPKQLDIIKRHMDDAIARGGTALVGGPDAIAGRFVQPTVLVNVPEDSIAVTEETFGPTLTVAKVRDMDDAVERANATTYGLGMSVFAKEHGVEIARRVRSGVGAVNSVLSYAAVPSLPLGGVGASGFGRVNGPDGLREFSYAKSITRQRFRPPVPLMTFARTASAEKLVATALTLLHGKRPK